MQTTTCWSLRRARTQMVPPSGVNLMLYDSGWLFGVLAARVAALTERRGEALLACPQLLNVWLQRLKQRRQLVDLAVDRRTMTFCLMREILPACLSGPT